MRLTTDEVLVTVHEYRPVVGDYVCCTDTRTTGYRRSGLVTKVGDTDFYLDGCGWFDFIAPNPLVARSWEKINPPEPDFAIGDIVLDAIGVCYRRLHLDSWQNFAGLTKSDDFPRRPLTRLVPEK